LVLADLGTSQTADALERPKLCASQVDGFEARTGDHELLYFAALEMDRLHVSCAEVKLADPAVEQSYLSESRRPKVDVVDSGAHESDPRETCSVSHECSHSPAADDHVEPAGVHHVQRSGRDIVEQARRQTGPTEPGVVELARRQSALEQTGSVRPQTLQVQTVEREAFDVGVSAQVVGASGAQRRQRHFERYR
jgi:hypothetical protein